MNAFKKRSFTGSSGGPAIAPKAARRPLLFMRPKQLVLLTAPLLEVLSQLKSVLQIITDDLVHVRQLEAREILHDFLRSRAAIECADDKVERYPTAAHTVHAVYVLRQGNCVDHLCRHNSNSTLQV